MSSVSSEKLSDIHIYWYKQWRNLSTADLPDFSLIPDAEVIVVVQDVIKEFSPLQHRNYYVRLNHTSLLQASLLFVGIPESSHSAVLKGLTEVKVRHAKAIHFIA